MLLHFPKGCGYFIGYPSPAIRLEALSELAKLADSLGFHRYWVAEHHGTPGLACNSPEVLIGPIASAVVKRASSL